MSCCCSAEAEQPTARDKLEFSKVCSSGFEKQRKITYYSESEEKKSTCDETQSQTSISSKFSEGGATIDDDEDIKDMVFVDGNEADLDACDDEEALMERVWWFAKPPSVPRQTTIVPARRVQVIKERLSSTVKRLPTLKDAFKDQVDRNMRQQRRVKGQQYMRVGQFDKTFKSSCQDDIKIPVPSCSRKLSELL